MRVNANLTLGEHDSVSGSYLYAVSDSRAAELGDSGEDLAGQLGATTLIDTLSHATATPYRDGDLSGVRVDFADEPLSTFNGTTLTDGITITRDGGDYVVDAPTLGDLSGEDTATLADAQITLSVTFPGAVVDHNGTLTGTTVTWDLTKATDAPHARGHATAPRFPWLIVAAGVLAAGAVTGIVWWARARRAARASTPSN